MTGTITIAEFSIKAQVEEVVYCRPINSDAIHKKLITPKITLIRMTVESFFTALFIYLKYREYNNKSQ